MHSKNPRGSEARKSPEAEQEAERVGEEERRQELRQNQAGGSKQEVPGMVAWRSCGICGVAPTFHDRGIFCYSSRDFCGDLYRHLGRPRRHMEGQMSKKSEWDKVDKATSVLLSMVAKMV